MSITKHISIESNMFSVQLCQRLSMPDEEYIIEKAKDFSLSMVAGIPLLWKDLYTLFRAYDVAKDSGTLSSFDISKLILNEAQICAELGISNLTSNHQTYYKSTLHFFRSIKFDEVAGTTPLLQAFNVLSFIVHCKKKEETLDAEDTIVLANYITEVNDAIAAKNVQATYDLGNESSSDLKQYNEGLSSSLEANIRTGLYDLSPVVKSIIQDDPNQSIPVNPSLLKLIKTMMTLDDKLGTALGSSVEQVETNDTNIKKTKVMTKTSQALKASAIDRARPDFKTKVARKDMQVKVKVAPTKSKQAAILALDDSGSMATIFKQSYVRGTLLKLLEDVVKGDMELVFHNYVTEIYNSRKATDLASAKELFDHINRRIPNGGGTDIGKIIQQLVDEISSKKAYVNPEIFIVCDGEDHVDASVIAFKGVVVNTVCLGVHNEGLKEVSKLSGGKYISETFTGNVYEDKEMLLHRDNRSNTEKPKEGKLLQ